MIAGSVADTLGYGGAITIIAVLTAASGLWVVFDMPAVRAPEGPPSPTGDPIFPTSERSVVGKHG